MAAQLNAEQLEVVRMFFASSQSHRYDEHDRRIETSSTMAPNDLDRKTFAYNDHGDVIRKSRSRLTRNTVLEKECLHQNRIALARIGRKHSFAINMIRTVIGSKRSLKLLADRYGVLSVERSVTLIN